MKLVERGNRQLQIPDELLEDYIEKGYYEYVEVEEEEEIVVEPEKPKK